MYKTFKRSCHGFKSFANARKITVDTGLTLEEAQRACNNFNNNRSASQIRRGTKLEFIQE